MALTNPNLVSKTVLASVTLPAPADRIGSGVNAIDHRPAAFLSPGHFSMPRLPEPEPRSRRTADATSMPPSGLPGWPAGSGTGTLAQLATTTRGTVKPTVPGVRPRAVKPSRVRYPFASPQRCGWQQMTTSTAKT